jgi:hypothetical protein
MPDTDHGANNLETLINFYAAYLIRNEIKLISDSCNALPVCAIN